tara:strand:+ start:1029 stop:1451 length:423 start_codon:yes stop_codon:yes gene_type:complete
VKLYENKLVQTLAIRHGIAYNVFVVWEESILGENIMAYRDSALNRIGEFLEKDYGNGFTYGVNEDGVFSREEYPHIVYVGGTTGLDYRYAKVLKTVAYVVVDEDENGAPVVEKWALKKNLSYGDRAPLYTGHEPPSWLTL